MVPQITENWQKMFSIETRKINEASIQIQYASQFIAILNKSLTNESNSSSEWLPSHGLLAGNWTKGKKLFRLALDITNFRLILLDNEIKPIDIINLQEKTPQDIYTWLQSGLTNLDVRVNDLKLVMHDEISDSKITYGEPFTKPAKEILIETSKIWHNAHLILSFISSKFKISEKVKVWPHHLETNVIIPVKINEKGGLLKSIKMGFSVADNISNEYYFYVYPWSATKIRFESLPDLSNKGKWHIQDWNGAYLPISEVYSANTKEEQVEIVNGFLISAIDACLYLLDSTGLFRGN